MKHIDTGLTHNKSILQTTSSSSSSTLSKKQSKLFHRMDLLSLDKYKEPKNKSTSSVISTQISTHSSETVRCKPTLHRSCSDTTDKQKNRSRKKSSSNHSKKHKRRDKSKTFITRILDFVVYHRHRAIFLIVVIVILTILYYNNISSNVMKEYKLLRKQHENAEHSIMNEHKDDVVPELHGLKNVWDTNEATDVPIFWHIAKSGGTSIKNVLSRCYSRILASEVGVRDGHGLDKHIQVFQYGGFPYVNVDSSTIQGIERARSMNLIGNNINGLAIVSPWLHNIEKLFSDDNIGRGRVFGMFREPIDRAVSMYHYLQYATWEPSYNPILKNMTLEQYADSKYIENNFVTRILTGKYTGALTENDALMATVILKRKILIGLQSQMMESMERYEKYFGWDKDSNYFMSRECRQKLLSVGSNVNIKKGGVGDGHVLPTGRAYHLLYHHNKFDIQIYNVAVSMFEEQRSLVGDRVALKKDLKVTKSTYPDTSRGP